MLKRLSRHAFKLPRFLWKIVFAPCFRNDWWGNRSGDGHCGRL